MTGSRQFAALLAGLACCAQVLGQGAANCEFSRFAQGRVFDFGVLGGGSIGFNTNLPLNGICSASARIEIQSPGGAHPEMRNAQNAALPYHVESIELTRDGGRSTVRLLLGIEVRDYEDIPPGVYEHHLVLTITP